jgi:hypothetical protein
MPVAAVHPGHSRGAYLPPPHGVAAPRGCHCAVARRSLCRDLLRSVRVVGSLLCFPNTTSTSADSSSPRRKPPSPAFDASHGFIRHRHCAAARRCIASSNISILMAARGINRPPAANSQFWARRLPPRRARGRPTWRARRGPRARSSICCRRRRCRPCDRFGG